jgi:DNA-binding NtrC family response regulator
MTSSACLSELPATARLLVAQRVRWSEALAVFEREYLRESLAQYKGSKSRVASLMGVHRNTLSRTVKKYGLEQWTQRRIPAA